MQANQDYSTKNQAEKTASGHYSPRILCGAFVGSFDPFHAGHKSIVVRALHIFERLIIGVGVNPEKNYSFTTEERVEAIRKVFAGEERVEVESYSGLTIDFARRHGAKFLVKGVRNAEDFLYEQRQAEWNKANGGIETILLVAEEELKELSSTKIKENDNLQF